jgi:drug/metabolite transporter (DMT)-like permease
VQFQSSFWAILVSTAILLMGQGTGSPIIDPVMPDMQMLLLIAGVGMAASLSGILGAYAYRAAPASVLAPLQYLEIVSAAMLAYFVFGDFPDALKWLGIMIIITSGVFIIVMGETRTTPPPDATV